MTGDLQHEGGFVTGGCNVTPIHISSISRMCVSSRSLIVSQTLLTDDNRSIRAKRSTTGDLLLIVAESVTGGLLTHGHLSWMSAMSASSLVAVN